MLPASGADATSHCDLTPFNLLITDLGTDSRLIGVLDGGDSNPPMSALGLSAVQRLLTDSELSRFVD